MVTILGQPWYSVDGLHFDIIIIRVISDYKLKWQSVQNFHTSILFKQWIMESSDIVYKNNQQLP